MTIQQLLGVSDFRGIEKALKRIHGELSQDNPSDVFWLVHWLDANSLKYTYKCEYDTDD